MRSKSHAPRPSVLAALVSVLALSACSDPARVVAPPPDALADKQSTTSERILFVRGFPGKVFSIEPDGTHEIQLTTGATSEFDPAWAPDGKRILFSSNVYNGTNYAIYVMNADGTGVTRLTSPSETQSDVSPASLGKRIVFARAEGLFYTLWMMEADGSNLTPLTSGITDISLAPSPGGKRLAFARNGDVYVLDVETGALTNLTASAAFERDPAWSPNGKQIAFARADGAGTSHDIFVMNADGTGATRLTEVGSTTEIYPRWSPDGKRIVFSANYTGDFGVWVMSADGSGLNLVTNTTGVNEIATAWAR